MEKVESDGRSGGEPSFPEDFGVLKKAARQLTDIKSNRNKNHALELHQAEADVPCNTGASPTTVGPTTWGRTPTPAGRGACYFVAKWAARPATTRAIARSPGRRKGTRRSRGPPARSARRRPAAPSRRREIDARTLERLARAKAGCACAAPATQGRRTLTYQCVNDFHQELVAPAAGRRTTDA